MKPGTWMERPFPRTAAAGDSAAGVLQFEGGRSAEELRKFWQNWEHPSINKQEWTRPELDRLKTIAAAHGHLHWQKVAEELGVRTSQTAGAWGAAGTGRLGGRHGR